jgi:hypothetical protein
VAGNNRPSLDEIFGAGAAPARPSLDEIFSSPAPATDDPGFLETAGRAALDTVGAVANKIDSVTGAPTRAAIGRMQDKGFDLSEAANAFKSQFAEDPALAPTGKEIAEKAGLDGKTTLSDVAPWAFTDEKGLTLRAKKGGFLDVSPAGAAGLAIDVVADPTNLLPPAKVAQFLGKGGRVAETIAARTGGKLRNVAEGLAERATGATRNQAEQFAEGAGRELLDRGVVRFGSTPGGIAERAGGVRRGAEEGIDAALTGLDAKGATLSRDQLLAGLYSRLAEFKADPSKAGVARKLEKIIDDVSKTEQRVPLAEAEQVKRGYQRQSNYTKPLTTEANKAAANVYREGVEDIATHADPSLAEQFKEGKKTYGLIAPIEEAAERRATQLNQHPMFGLNDVAAVTAGAAASGAQDPESALKGAALGFLGRRVVGPRIASSAAVSSDVAGKILERTAKARPLSRVLGDPTAVKAGYTAAMGAERSSQGPNRDWKAAAERLRGTTAGARFLPRLEQAAQQNGGDASVAHYIMMQQYPEYRSLVEDDEE